MSVTADVAHARPAPAAELRTSLALASLGAALVHVMGAVHGAGAPALYATAAIQIALAAVLAFTGVRSAFGPALAINATLTLGWAWSRVTGLPIDLPGVLAALSQIVIAGGALALLRNRGDVACTRWSRLAFMVFAVAALTGFGHLGH